MTVLGQDIAAYERFRKALEAEHPGDWAVFKGAAFVGVFPDFEQAASLAVELYGSGPYLIRQIGVKEIALSSTLMFRPAHAGASGL